MCQSANKEELQLLKFQLSTQTMPDLWEEVYGLWKDQSLQRYTTVHDIEQEPDQYNVEEDHIDTVNINSIIFKSKWLAITENLKMSSSQFSIIIPYKVDKDSDGNIMP